MAINIISNSIKTINIPGGYAYTLYVHATTDTGTLTYQWSKDGEDIVDATNNIYTIAEFTSDNIGVYSCAVNNGVDNTVFVTDINVNHLDIWSGGSTAPLLPGLPTDTFPITEDTFVKGGVHVYNTVDELCYSPLNFERIKYGQLAIVPNIETGVSRYFTCNIYDPVTLYTNNSIARKVEQTAASLNAANWTLLTPGPGSNAEAHAVLTGSDVLTITVDVPGIGYDPSNTFVGLSTNEASHTGILFGRCVPTIDANGAIQTITVRTGSSRATGYIVPPVVVIMSGVVEKIPTNLQADAPPWTIGVDWVELPPWGSGGDTTGEELTFVREHSAEYVEVSTLVHAQSATWMTASTGSGDVQVNTLVHAQSATWMTASTGSGDVQVNTLVQQQSATWMAASTGSGDVEVSTLVHAQSATWMAASTGSGDVQVNTLVHAQSATWMAASTGSGDVQVNTLVHAQSATWINTNTFVQQQSATWMAASTGSGDVEVNTLVHAQSANWIDTRMFVQNLTSSCSLSSTKELLTRSSEVLSAIDIIHSLPNIFDPGEF